MPPRARRGRTRLVRPSQCRLMPSVSVEVSGNSPGTGSQGLGPLCRCGCRFGGSARPAAGPPSHLVQGDEGGFVGGGQGVQVDGRGGDVRVAKAFSGCWHTMSVTGATLSLVSEILRFYQQPSPTSDLGRHRLFGVRIMWLR